MFQYCNKYQLHGGSSHLLSAKKDLKKGKRCFSYETVLARLACKIQHLNVYQTKIAAKIIVKVCSLHTNAQTRG